MGTIMPQGESLRQAVKWISERLKENESEDKKQLVREAISLFDLSPKDAQFLIQMYRDA